MSHERVQCTESAPSTKRALNSFLTFLSLIKDKKSKVPFKKITKGFSAAMRKGREFKPRSSLSPNNRSNTDLIKEKCMIRLKRKRDKRVNHVSMSYKAASASSASPFPMCATSAAITSCRK